MSFIQNTLIEKDKKIIIAFSGGVDSLALALLLSHTHLKEHLHLVYVNHRLRDEKELLKEEELNKKNADSLDLSFEIIRLKEGEVAALAKTRGGIEAAARQLRYEVLEEKRRELGFDYIATAHTADDQVETLLMRMFMGSSLLSMEGIFSQRESIIRPLLSYTKKELIEMVKEKGLTWSEDSTNSEDLFLRNNIRANITKNLYKVFPSYATTINRFSTRASLLKSFVTEKLNELEKEVTYDKSIVRAPLAPLKQAHPILLESLIYKMWNTIHLPHFHRLSYESVQRCIEAIKEEKEVLLEIGNTLFECDNMTLTWKIEQKQVAESYLSYVYSERTPLVGGKQLIRRLAKEAESVSPFALQIDERVLVPPIIVRSVESGDQITLKEGTKKVRELISSWNVDKDRISEIPVLEDQKGIYAVLGAEYGGRDRLAKRLLRSTLAHSGMTIYSVTDVKG